VHRAAISRERRVVAATFERPAGPRYVSDTGELVWDLTDKMRGVVTVNALRSKAVIGYGGGKRFDLGGVLIEPGPTAQDGWCTVTVTVLEGELGSARARLLVTATGLAENSGMTWTSPAHDSVGRDWGRAPSRVEGIPAQLTLPVAAGRTTAWSLDERGRRRTALPVANTGRGEATITIGPRWETLWYEVEINRDDGT
jgi:hypothetical protein